MKNQYEIDYQQGYDKANDEWLERIDEMIKEIDDVETGGDPWELNLKDEILDIIHKYTDKEQKQ